MNCTRCGGTGFLNAEQIPDEVFQLGTEAILAWIADRNRQLAALGGGCYCAATKAPCGWCELWHDVQVCDCCGDGRGWYGEPGRHYTNQDPPGRQGPYAYNGGWCECN
jgi:hypothetical protein